MIKPRLRAVPVVGSMWAIIGVYSRATRLEMEEGQTAYAGYHQTMVAFAEAYGHSVETVAGVFAALSPVNGYWGNLRSMKSILDGFRAGLPVEAITTSTTHRNRLNAYKIVHGAPPVTCLNGPKVWNFFNNILDPASPAYVTIDRHALSVWLGKRSVDGRVPRYSMVAADYMNAAKELDVLPNVLQACVWFSWKRLNNILYDDTADMFYDGSSVRTTIRVDEVHAFRPKRRSDQRLAEREAVVPSVLQTSFHI